MRHFSVSFGTNSCSAADWMDDKTKTDSRFECVLWKCITRFCCLSCTSNSMHTTEAYHSKIHTTESTALLLTVDRMLNWCGFIYWFRIVFTKHTCMRRNKQTDDFRIGCMKTRKIKRNYAYCSVFVLPTHIYTQKHQEKDRLRDSYRCVI